MKQKATYVSEWDGGDVIIKTDCMYDPDTNEVSDVESVDVEGVSNLDVEYIEFDDEIIYQFSNEYDEYDLADEELTDEEIEKLKQIFKK